MAAAAAAGGSRRVTASMMKFKPNQTRTYDREGYKKRAACLCFRSEREDEVSPPSRRARGAGGAAPGPAGVRVPPAPPLPHPFVWPRGAGASRGTSSARTVVPGLPAPREPAGEARQGCAGSGQPGPVSGGLRAVPARAVPGAGRARLSPTILGRWGCAPTCAAPPLCAAPAPLGAERETPLSGRGGMGRDTDGSARVIFGVPNARKTG